jgi:hypothetical protein
MGLSDWLYDFLSRELSSLAQMDLGAKDGENALMVIFSRDLSQASVQLASIAILSSNSFSGM